MARGHRSAWFPLLSACCFVEFDTSIICHVLVYCFLLISIARYIFKSPRICFWGTKYDVYRERVVYLHYILWRRARLWLELFASTADKFFSRVSYLPSHVFLRRHRRFPSRKLYACLEKFLRFLQLSEWKWDHHIASHLLQLQNATLSRWWKNGTLWQMQAMVSCKLWKHPNKVFQNKVVRWKCSNCWLPFYLIKDKTFCKQP